MLKASLNPQVRDSSPWRDHEPYRSSCGIPTAAHTLRRATPLYVCRRWRTRDDLGFCQSQVFFYVRYVPSFRAVLDPCLLGGRMLAAGRIVENGLIGLDQPSEPAGQSPMLGLGTSQHPSAVGPHAQQGRQDRHPRPQPGSPSRPLTGTHTGRPAARDRREYCGCRGPYTSWRLIAAAHAGKKPCTVALCEPSGIWSGSSCRRLASEMRDATPRSY
jgi:hypothetical protein